MSWSLGREDYDVVVDEIYRLREMKQKTLKHSAGRQVTRQRIAEMAGFLKKQDGLLTEYDVKLVRQLIERITVLEDKLTVVFKSGIEVDVEL